MNKKQDATYLTARIARDFPDIAEEMKEGKYPSVRAAARGVVRLIARGFLPIP